jgi:hypothetical protein
MKIKPLYRFLVWIAIIATFVIAFLAYHFQQYEKNVFLSVLHSSLGQDVTATDVDYNFPFGFSLDNFKIGDFLQSKKLSAQFDPQSIRKKQIILTELMLHQPIITWYKGTPAAAVVDLQLDTGPTPPDKAPTTKSDIKLLVKKLIVKGGRLHYADASSEIPFDFQLDNVQLNADDLIFPIEPKTTTFRFKGTLIKKGTALSGSVIKSDGWIDAARRDLDGQIMVLEKDERVGLSAHAVAKNNDLNVTGKVLAKNLFTSEHSNKLEGKVDDFLLSALSSLGVELSADFAFKTKLDDLRIDEISFSGSVSSQESTRTNPVAP